MLLTLLLQVDTQAPDVNPFLGFLLLLAAGFFYFLPAVVARKHRQASAIFLLNLFTGWTLIGWLAALIWAMTAPSRPVVVHHPVSPRPSVADELQKLQALRDGGTITAAEFDQQKARLLA